MTTLQIHASPEFRIYGEILHGRLQPFKPQFNDNKLLSKLIEYANTKELSISKNGLNNENIMSAIEYEKLGYRNTDDFITTINAGIKTDSALMTIIPNKYYLLGDMMDNNIDKPPCYKSNSYLRLIMDEFERIKIRACNLLNSIENPDQLKLLALKNLRIAEYLLRETSAFCHFLLVPKDDNHKRSLYYIHDCMKKFIIKSILFYHRLFDPYITEYFGQSKRLINNIDRATSSDCIKYVYQDNIENCIEEQNTVYEINPDHKVSTHKLQWSGKINLLASLFYDLMEQGIICFPSTDNSIKNAKVSRVSKNSKTNMDLVEFLYNNFLDNTRKTLSKDTLRTYLNPNKPDKRSQRSQDLHLDKYI